MVIIIANNYSHILREIHQVQVQIMIINILVFENHSWFCVICLDEETKMCKSTFTFERPPS